MKSTFKLFLVLITLTVFVVTWITHQLGNPRLQLLIGILTAITLAAFFTMIYWRVMANQDKKNEDDQS